MEMINLKQFIFPVAANIEKLGRHAEGFKKKQAVPKSFERVGEKVKIKLI